MIQEAYVSFETAKLLKEKGFDEQLCHFYTEEGLPVIYKTEEGVVLANNSKSEHAITQPTQQMAMRWLREVHKIHINTVYLGPTLKWTPTIWQIDMTIPESKHIKSTLNTWESYEEACEAAIKYCLENLI